MLESPVLTPYFLLRSASRICALPLGSVIEVLRPLPLRPVQGSPPFVSGVAVIRGSAVPVVDLDLLLGGQGSSRPGRFVTLRVGARTLALAAESVLGLRPLEESVFQALPPLLRNSGTPAVEALGALDSEFLVLLQASRILPDLPGQGPAAREELS